MNDFNQSYAPRTGSMDTSTDAGLRSFMLGVYNKLALGIAISGMLAYAVGTVEPLTQLVWGTPIGMVVQFAPLVLILASAFLMKNPSPMGSAIMYWAIVGCIGVSASMWVVLAGVDQSVTTRGGASLSVDFMTITKAFLVTASAFAALSLFGYTTKMNMRPIGTFMIIGLWGLVAIGLVSLFFPPSGLLELGLQVGILLLSAGLVAWQTQELKEGYYGFGGDARSMAVMTNWGALNFFILFYNMFTIILSLMSRD
ncbi:MAG: Bax inhibitor-1/YccA family protein [Pseudomonadota bacterium]